MNQDAGSSELYKDIGIGVGIGALALGGFGAVKGVGKLVEKNEERIVKKEAEALAKSQAKDYDNWLVEGNKKKHGFFGKRKDPNAVAEKEAIDATAAGVKTDNIQASVAKRKAETERLEIARKNKAHAEESVAFDNDTKANEADKLRTANAAALNNKTPKPQGTQMSMFGNNGGTVQPVGQYSASNPIPPSSTYSI